MRVNAQFEGDGVPAQRAVVDIRTIYLNRLREIYARLRTEGILEAELKTMLDRANDYATRITKWVEEQEDSRRLPENELGANLVMWEEATDLADRIKTDINTKLMYYQAGAQPNAQDQRRVQTVRRLQAKIEPFGGNVDDWPNFKTKWVEFYHNSNDLSALELFMKLDEFIIPQSDAYNLIVSYDRAIDGAYDDAWKELCSHYDNPRLQVDGTIAKLTRMVEIKDRREHYLRAYTTINTFVHSLPRMQVDVSTWDPIVVHLVERKMYDEVMNKWQRARAPREIARLEPLVNFFRKEIDRADAPTNGNANNRDQSRERRRQQQPQPQRGQQPNRGPSNQNNQRNGQQQNVQRQPPNGSSQPSSNSRPRQDDQAGAAGGAPLRLRSAVQKVLKCTICNSEAHKTYVCPTLTKAELNERLQMVRARKLCINCIRPNCHPDRCTLRPCINSGCTEKHNRLLCPLTFLPTVNNAVPEQPKA